MLAVPRKRDTQRLVAEVRESIIRVVTDNNLQPTEHGWRKLMAIASWYDNNYHWPVVEQMHRSNPHWFHK
jgi:hypothetical protein